MACAVKSVSGCLAQSFCTLHSLKRPLATAKLEGQWTGLSNCRRGRVQQSLGRSSRRRWSLSVSAIAEKTEETQAEPVFKLKIENVEDDAPAAPRWTGLVEKDTAGQTNIYSVEPTVYVADGLLSTNSQGTGGSSSNTVAFIGTALLFTALAIGGAVNISQYKASEQAAVPVAEYSGPPLSYYIEKFSEVSAAPSLTAPALVEEVVGPSEPLTAVVVPEVEEVVAVPEAIEAVVGSDMVIEPPPPEPEAVGGPEAVVVELYGEDVSLPSLEEGVQTASVMSEEVAGEPQGYAVVDSFVVEQPALVAVADA